MTESKRPSQVDPQWAAFRWRVRDLLEDLYEHAVCDNTCPHAADAKRALDNTITYIVEIANDELAPLGKGSSQ